MHDTPPQRAFRPILTRDRAHIGDRAATDSGRSPCATFDGITLAAVTDAIRRRVVVHGRVQGVFFRDTCRREAAARGVAGWVANRADGAVEAAFEGAPDEVEAMVEWTRHGPPAAEVTHVDAHPEPVEGIAGFQVW